MNYGEKSPALWDAIKSEEKRQEDTIELIASENIYSLYQKVISRPFTNTL